MAREWRQMRFSQAVTLNPRVDIKRGEVYPFVDMGSVNAGSRSVFASERRAFTGGGSRFSAGDTLMARITPCLENGKIARFAGEPGTVAHGSTEFIVIRGRSGVTETDYAYYLTKWDGIRAYAIGQMTGTSGRQRVPTEAFDHLDVPVPPISEQRAIAYILGTLDDKIEINRRMSETLEAMATALFKSWFIDFEPVRRNAARARSRPSPPAPLPGGEGRRCRGGYVFAGLVETARRLRKEGTPAEDVFWALVRNRRFAGLKFRRQHQIGDYIADFYCDAHRLVVELDGPVHATHRGKDRKRDAWMRARGFTVLRFSNDEFLRDPGAVLDAISQSIRHPSLGLPSPHGRRAGDEGSVEELDRLFPDDFQPSELGPIPKGWETRPLPDVIEVNPVRSLRKGTVAPYLDMANMPTSGHSPDMVCERPYGSGMRFINGDTLVARITPCLENGKTAFVDFLSVGQVAWGSTEYIVLRSKPPLPPEFSYLMARSERFREFAIQSMTGSSGRQRVPADSLAHFRLSVPKETVLNEFGDCIRAIMTRVSAASQESRNLAALRDTLLPKLISGELPVKGMAMSKMALGSIGEET